VNYDWPRIYKNLQKPAFILDGRNIMKATELKEIGVRVVQMGKAGKWPRNYIREYPLMID